MNQARADDRHARLAQLPRMRERDLPDAGRDLRHHRARAARSTTRWCASRSPTSCRPSRPRSRSASSARSCRQLQTVYAGTAWGLTAGSRRLSVRGAVRRSRAGRRHLELSPARSGTYQGLLPFNQANCTASASEPALPAGSGAHQLARTTRRRRLRRGRLGVTSRPSRAGARPAMRRASARASTTRTSTYPSNPGMRIEMQVTLRNVAMGLRRFDTTRMQVEARDDGTMTWLAQTVSQRRRSTRTAR